MHFRLIIERFGSSFSDCIRIPTSVERFSSFSTNSFARAENPAGFRVFSSVSIRDGDGAAFPRVSNEDIGGGIRASAHIYAILHISSGSRTYVRFSHTCRTRPQTQSHLCDLQARFKTAVCWCPGILAGRWTSWSCWKPVCEYLLPFGFLSGTNASSFTARPFVRAASWTRVDGNIMTGNLKTVTGTAAPRKKYYLTEPATHLSQKFILSQIWFGFRRNFHRQAKEFRKYSLAIRMLIYYLFNVESDSW